VSTAGDAVVEAWTVDPDDLGSHWGQHAAFIRLDGEAAGTLNERPAVPLIGLGDAGHPLAASMDALVEAPASAEGLVRSISAAPHAAAVAAQLLRNLRGVPMTQALPLESLGYAALQGSAEHAAWLAARTVATAARAPGRLLVERDAAVLHLTLDRAGARNAIDRALRDQLYDAFSLATLAGDIECVKLRARGAAFSIGGDLQEFGTTRDPATAHLIRSRTLPAIAIARCPAKFEVHVQGACIGAGIELAAFASRLTAEPDAWFQLPELAMGLIPGAGGCVSIPARIGRQRAALMILSGRRVNAPTALRWGLIDAIESRPAL
jgi:enoyl-CoA hydratase/carnithine racemase